MLLSPGSSWRDVAALGGAFALAYAAGVVVVLAPAGVGAREGVFVLLLSPLLGVADATAVALLARVVHTAADGVMAAGGGTPRPVEPGQATPAVLEPERRGRRCPAAGPADEGQGPEVRPQDVGTQAHHDVAAAAVGPPQVGVLGQLDVGGAVRSAPSPPLLTDVVTSSAATTRSSRSRSLA